MSQQEFNQALIELEPNLERFAYSLTANREDARDLLQETYLKALTYKDKFEDNTNIKAWTFTIMKNTFINNYRKSVKQSTTFDGSTNQFLINSKPDSFGPDAMYSHSEISCLLYTSDAADDLLCVDLGGRRIIKKKTTYYHTTFNR